MSSQLLDVVRVGIELAHLLVEVYDRWANRDHRRKHPQQINYVYYNEPPPPEEEGEELESLSGDPDWSI